MKPTVIGAEIKAPIFRVSPLGLQVRLTYLLPTPRTLAGLFASCIGKYLGLNPEGTINGKKLSEILMWEIVASNAILTCRVSKYLIKFQSTMKVWWIERHDLLRAQEERKEAIMDAVKTEHVFCDKLITYIVFDPETLSKKLNDLLLEKIGIERTTSNEIPKLIKNALALCERIGDSESIATVVKLWEPEIRGIHRSGAVTTMTPIKWMTRHNAEIIQPMPATPKIVNEFFKLDDHRSVEVALPLKAEFGKLLYYVNSGFEAEAAKGYTIIDLEGGDSILVPEDSW